MNNDISNYNENPQTTNTEAETLNQIIQQSNKTIQKQIKTNKIITLTALLLACISILLIIDKPSNLPPTVINTVDKNESWTTTYETVGKSVVKIKTVNGGNGTGFYYTPNLILTAAHVINSDSVLAAAVGGGKTPKIDLISNTDEPYTGTVIHVDPRLDVAIIKTSTTKKPVALTQNTSIGQQVATIGYPFSQEATISTGVLSSIRFHPKQATDPAQTWMLQTDAVTNPGSSGGPLLDKTGKIIGMVTLRPTKIDNKRADGITLAVPSPILISVTTKLAEQKPVELPWVGFVVNENLTITDIATPSPAQEIGLETGYQIKKVDGIKISDRAALYSYIAQKNINDSILLTVSSPKGPIDIKLNLEERP